MNQQEKHELIQQPVRQQALTSVQQFETDTRLSCVPDREIRPICTFRAKSEVFDSFVFSPNGQYIALKTAERVYLWDRQQGRSIQIFNHSCFVETLTFNRDGQLLITADNQKQLHVWDLQTGECVRLATMDDTASKIYAVTDELLLIWGFWKKLSVWEIQTGKRCFSVDGGSNGIALTPDEKALITTNYLTEEIPETKRRRGFYTLNFWDLQTGTCLEERRLVFPGLKLGEIVITPDGKSIISVSNDDKAISIIDLKNGDVRRINYEYLNSEKMAGAKISPKGDLLLAYGGIHCANLYLWDIESGTCLEVIPGKWESSAFSPDGKAFAAIRPDGAVQLWEISSGQSYQEVNCHADSQTNFALSPKGDVFVTDASDNALTIWDLHLGHPRHRLAGHRKFIGAVAFSPDGKTLASASQDDTIRLWDVETGQCISVWRLSRRPLSIVFSPNGEYLAVAEGHALEEQWITIRAIRTGQVMYHLPREDYFDQSLAFSRDGRALFMGRSNKACLWDFETGKLQQFNFHTKINDRSTSLLFFPEKNYLIGKNRKNIYVYDLNSGKEVSRMEGHQNDVSALALHPKKQTLISADDDNQIYEWDLNSGVRLRAFEGLPPCHWRWRHPRNLALSLEGKLLIAVSFDGMISCWDYESGRPLATAYALDEGYLWTTPPDEFAKHGWLHTDRPDLVSLTALDSESGQLEYLDPDDERYTDYMRIYNDGEMVMNRLNNWARYRELLRVRLGNKDAMADHLLENGQAVRLRLTTGKHPSEAA